MNHKLPKTSWLSMKRDSPYHRRSGTMQLMEHPGPFQGIALVDLYTIAMPRTNRHPKRNGLLAINLAPQVQKQSGATQDRQWSFWGTGHFGNKEAPCRHLGCKNGRRSIQLWDWEEYAHTRPN